MSEDSKRERRRTLLVVVALGVVLTLGILTRRGPIDYNLPVASNVDERISVTVLRQLDRPGLNPEYFHYPSLYYYVNHFALRPFDDVARVLRQGRILNLIFACGLVLTTYTLTRRYFASRAAGVMAAAMVMFSPILIESGAYIITDVLLALLVTAALICFGAFVERGSMRWWLAAILLSGPAISTKYSALILVPFYLLLEYVFAARLRERIPPAGEQARFLSRLVRREVTPRTLAIAGAALAIALVGAGLFFPEEYFLGIVEARQEMDSILDEADRVFIASVGRAILVLGIASGLFSALCLLAPRAAKRFTSVRPGIGAVLMVVAFLLGSPFILVSWEAFLFEFGYELKANQLSGDERLWFTYVSWLFDEDSRLVLVFGGVGLWYALARRRSALPLVLYLAIGYMSIGSATRGAERYLAPVLPVLYALASFGIVSVTRSLQGLGRPFVAGVFVALSAFGIAAELRPKVLGRLAARSGVDEMHQSYRFVTGGLDIDRILWAGYVPLVELQEQGFTLERVPLSWLATESPVPRMGPRDLLLVDGASYAVLGSIAHDQLELIWSTDEGYGQFALRWSEDSG